MTFFEKKQLWKSLLELGDNDDIGENEDKDADGAAAGTSPSLDDAATIARFLSGEENVRPAIHGVISVKIRMATLIKFEKSSSGSAVYFCQISVRNLIKRTRMVNDNQGSLRWDQIKHFPTTVVRNRRHPYNLLQIHLFSFESNRPSDVFEIGSVLIHVHDIIKANPIAGTYDLWNDNIQVGDVDLELTFTYGSFGYGYSHQLREEDITAHETVQYSLLPRIKPRKDQREPDEAVMVVCATPHPTFIPFKECVYLSYGKEIQEALEEAKNDLYQPESFVKEMSRFEQIRDEYYSTTDRVSRLLFLRNYIQNSANQQETMVHVPNQQPSETLPAKSYVRFSVPPLGMKTESTAQTGSKFGKGRRSIIHGEASSSSVARNPSVGKSREFLEDVKTPGSWPAT